MKSLILAEKPSVEIAEALNIENIMDILQMRYIVTWGLGHLVTNAQPEHYDKTYKEWKLEDLPILPKQMHTVVIGRQVNSLKL